MILITDTITSNCMYVALTVFFSAHFQCISQHSICTLDLQTCWSLLENLVCAHSQSSQSLYLMYLNFDHGLVGIDKQTHNAVPFSLVHKSSSNLPPCTSITMTFQGRSCSVPKLTWTYIISAIVLQFLHQYNYEL